VVAVFKPLNMGSVVGCFTSVTTAVTKCCKT
jgi:hypothetical protein